MLRDNEFFSTCKLSKWEKTISRLRVVDWSYYPKAYSGPWVLMKTTWSSYTFLFYLFLHDLQLDLLSIEIFVRKEVNKQILVGLAVDAPESNLAQVFELWTLKRRRREKEREVLFFITNPSTFIYLPVKSKLHTGKIKMAYLLRNGSRIGPPYRWS